MRIASLSLQCVRASIGCVRKLADQTRSTSSLPSKFVEYVNFCDHAERETALGPPCIGYPQNLHRISELAELRKICYRSFVTNNCGDPFQEGERHYRIHTYEQEANVLRQLMEPWGGNEANCWGYICTGGTEGVTKGLSAGLFRLHQSNRKVMVVYCTQSHYSVAKAAHMLLGEKSGNKGLLAKVPSNAKGEMSLSNLKQVVDVAPMFGVEAILCVCTLGTTFMGANDDIRAVRKVFSDGGYDGDKVYLHLDAALNGGWWNYAPDTPKYKLGVDFDSISISGHKWYGGFICGAVMILKGEGLAEGTSVEYIQSVDRMICGSRPGEMAVLWQARLFQFDWPEELARCIANAHHLVSLFQGLGVSCSLQSMNVTFPSPSRALAVKYQLMTVGENCQICVLPHVDRSVLEAFADEYAVEVAAGTIPRTTALLEDIAAESVAVG